jgi:hypothetical protein
VAAKDQDRGQRDAARTLKNATVAAEAGPVGHKRCAALQAGMPDTTQRRPLAGRSHCRTRGTRPCVRNLQMLRRLGTMRPQKIPDR